MRGSWRRWARKRISATAVKPTGRTRLTLETLEDRCLLATRIWTGGAISNNWTTPGNWQGNVAPVAGDDLVFPTGVSDKVADNNFSADTFFRSITVAGGYDLRGARVLLGDGGIVSSGSSNFIRLKMHLGSAGAGNRTIQVNTGSTLFIDDDIVGSNGFNKTGGGDLSLRNNNSYSGITDIVGGRLIIERDEALGAFGSSASRTIIRNGAQLLLNDNLPAAVLRVDETITIENGGSIRGLNDVHLRGSLTTTGTATLQHDGSLIERLLITGQISGSGGITIANGSGQVWMKGEVGNTYSGLTNVLGRLRLDHSGDDAISGNLTIQSTGKVRMNGAHQISDGATVTIIGGGVMLTDGFDETIHKLVMQGGLISGDSITLVDSLVDGISTIYPPVGKIYDFIQEVYPFNDPVWQINELVAGSDATGRAAHLLDLKLNLTSATGLVQVNDGAGATDLLVNAKLSSNGTVLTFTGPGTTVLQDKPMEDYVVNGGHLNLAKFRREAVVFDFSDVDVTLNAGGKFSSDTTIKNLTVNAGGRVRPGPLNFHLSLYTIGQLLRGTTIDPGSLEINGDLIMQAGAIIEVQLNGPIAGVQHEQLNVAGSVQIDGVQVEATLGGSVNPGQNYRIINNANADPIFGFIAIPPDPNGLLTATGGQKLAVNHAGGTLNNDLVLTLQNTPPMAPDLTLDRLTLDEGGVVTATGALVDPDPRDQLRLFVNWGDGSPIQIFRPGRSQFALQHQYRQDGNYTARFTWLDQHNQGNSLDFNLTVNNLPPAITFALGRDREAGSLLLGGLARDPGRDALVVSVDFGDGTPARLAKLSALGHFWLRHRYLSEGTYTVAVTARDSHGAEFTRTKTVKVVALAGRLVVFPTFGA